MAIFKYATQPERDENPAFKIRTSADGWRPFDHSDLVAIGAVCRQWYETIRADPLRWVCVDNHNSCRLQMFTERSSPLPLTLFLASWSDVDVLLALREHGTRAKRLHVSYSTKSPCPLEAFSFPAPSLETFILYGSDNFNASADLHVDESLLFGTQAHPLRAIAISPVVDWLPGNRFPNLTHLYLSFDLRPSNQLSDILIPLSNSPHLEVVQLARVPVRLDVRTTHGGNLIVLQHLKHIMFLSGSDFQSSIALLRRLELASTAFVYFDAISVGSSTVADGVVDSSLLPPWRGGDITRLEVGTEYTAMHLLVEGPSSGIFLRTAPDEYEAAPGEYWVQWLFALPAIFPTGLTTVRVARIRLDSAGNNISRLLCAMSQVEELEIIFPFYGDVPSSSEGEDSLDHVSRILSRECPQLHTFIVILEQDRMASVETYERQASRLIAMLDARTRIGKRVRRLRFQVHWRPSEREDDNKIIYPLFRPAGEHVDEYESYEADERLSGFRTRPEWWDLSEDDPERYWDLEEEDWPMAYQLPWLE